MSKGEIARFVQFLLLLLCFQKAVWCDMRERVKTLSPGNPIVSEEGCQSRSYGFVPQLCQHSFRRLVQIKSTRQASFVILQLAQSICGKAASCLGRLLNDVLVLEIVFENTWIGELVAVV